jgi:ribosomal protein L10
MTLQDLIKKRDELRKQYKEHPSKMLAIRGKLLTWAIEKATKDLTVEEIFTKNVESN